MGYNNGNCFEVDTYTGNELNWLCKSVYDNLGRIVESSWGKDGGVDLTIKKYRGILCIQCKSGKNQVGTPEIRDFNTACQLKGGEGWMISIGGYSRDAIRLAEDLGIDLLDYSDLCADAKKANMKLLYFGEEGSTRLCTTRRGTMSSSLGLYSKVWLTARLERQYPSMDQENTH